MLRETITRSHMNAYLWYFLVNYMNAKLVKLQKWATSKVENHKIAKAAKTSTFQVTKPSSFETLKLNSMPQLKDMLAAVKQHEVASDTFLK